MEVDKLKKLLNKFDSKIIYYAELKKKNWFNIGGKRFSRIFKNFK